MKDLRYLVKGPDLKKDPKCNFSNLVAGSSNYFRAVFDFNDEWSGMKCIAEFEANGKSSYVPIVGKSCMIPDEPLKYKTFKLRIIGVKDGMRIVSKWNTVTQFGGEV